jgi:hypothetical protein
MGGIRNTYTRIRGNPKTRDNLGELKECVRVQTVFNWIRVKYSDGLL